MIIYVLLIAGVLPTIVKTLYDPKRKYIGYVKRDIMHLKPNSDLIKIRITCLHKPDNISSVLSLLQLLSFPPNEDSNNKDRGVIAVTALHLVKLAGRSFPILIPHDKRTKPQLRQNSYIQTMMLVFSEFQQENWASTTVSFFTAYSHEDLMDHDICKLALDHHTSMIVVPSGRKWSPDGLYESDDSVIRSVNVSLLDRAPCSVGVLNDRSYRTKKKSNGTVNVGVIFIGGKCLRKKKDKKKKKRKEVDVEPGPLSIAVPDTEDPSPDEVPLKKKRKKSSEVPRASSVCEEELRALEPQVPSENRGFEDDDNQTVADRARELKRRAADQKGVLEEGVPDLIGVSGVSPRSRERSSPFLDGSPSPIQEGSETRTSGCRGDVSSDKFSFEFNRELPLTFYPEECGRLMLKFKGGPGQMPPADELIFRDEYEHAASSSVKSHGDWNVLIGKYNAALRLARTRIREDADAKKKAELAHEEILRADSIRDLEIAVDKLEREKAELEAKRAAEALRHSEEMGRLRKSRNDTGIESVQPASVDKDAPQDGVAPTIVLSDSPAKTPKALSSSSSSSEDPEAEDGALKERSAAKVNSPVSAFGRVSGPEGGGNEDRPVADE
ncbi:hypothetical protein Bca52824_036392 [Brassica carinata]|uniref:Cation/H(+) antiporter central domain-containing protein n=1 Tax=Brassica carinata TaxID=52824 RepID=A0A8X7S724_BRACI|nr:hypothetical protein Bca52824_036392 [Brassica carinata]